MTTPVFIDIFSSGLDELTRRQQADIATVLTVLDRTKRYSVFEATDNQMKDPDIGRYQRYYSIKGAKHEFRE